MPAADPQAERRSGGDRPDDYRTAYGRDLDRILYSSAFRRLNGITQVVSADETLLFHNRLTHSLKVAQIAKRLSERLCKDFADQLKDGPGLDAQAAEAAALAHDLGHPPFGHIAEEVLLDLCDEAGINGYEGNAQTFRIVTRLSWRTASPGMNLTRRTLRAILKYPWLRTGDNAGKKKWGAYESEAADFAFATEDQAEPRKSLEAQIMDWADDITYAVHDLEDFHRAGLTPIARMHTDEFERQRFIGKATRSLDKYPEFDAETGARAFSEILQAIPFERPYEGTNDDRRRVHETASVLISRFIDNTRLAFGSADLSISPDIWHEVNMLKQLTWHYVINSPDLATIQEGQKHIIQELFRYLVAWASREKNTARLPTRFRETLKAIRLDDEAKAALGHEDEKIFARAAADYVASLTEAQAVELYGRLFGFTRSSVLHGWVRA